MNCALHTCVGDHAEDAGLESSVKGRQRLLSVNGASTRHDTIVGASLLQVQPHLQHLYGRHTRFTPFQNIHRLTIQIQMRSFILSSYFNFKNNANATSHSLHESLSQRYETLVGLLQTKEIINEKIITENCYCLIII